MCGIFGGFGVARVPDQVFAAMAQRLLHRGPDGVALERRGALALGLTRLAIVGAGDAAQVARAGRVSSVMNGELYNHRALRRGLDVVGRSDAALVPALFAREGRRFVERLQGPFAIALHDGKALHLVRDRLGKKPLYFRSAGRKVFFASEQKALTITPGFEARVDERHVEAFLRRGYLRDDELVFAELSAVAPGEWVTIDARGAVSRRRWWRLTDQVARRAARRPLAQVGRSLRAAVDARVPDEVPWALLLSGGLDSTLLGAAVRGRRPRAFCMEQPGAGDAARAGRAARALKVPLQTVRLRPPDVASFKRALFHLEQPDAHSAWAMAPAVLQLGEALRARGVKVALLGEGADELFGGYAWDVLQAGLERGRGARPADARRLLGRRARLFALNHSIARLYGPTPRARDVWLATAGAFAVSGDCDAGLSASLPGARRRQLVGLGHDMLTLPIVHADRLLMASGVEPRLPFLDHRLVTLALSLRAASLESADQDKPVLRALARRWVPGWKAPAKVGFSAAALPPPKVVRALVAELARGTPVVVDRAWFRARARRADPQGTWRRVVLELSARLLTQ